MQKNTGLVPVPDLPSKPFFSSSGEDFLEKRRKGLQSFLDKVCSMTVCLSDSQLHLFLQTQLPVGHILDCVQGHTPYTVTEAILTYGSSNEGRVPEEDSAQDPSLTPVPYESMESPVPHLPTLRCEEPLTPVNLTSSEPEGLRTEKFLADPHDIDAVEFKLGENPSSEVTQEDHDVVHVEAALETHSPVETIYKWEGHEDSTPERWCEVIHHQGDCQQQTLVEAHSEKYTGLEEECVTEVKNERVIEETHTDTTTQTIPPKQSSPELDIHEETPQDGLRETVLEDLNPAEEAQETTSEGDSDKDTVTAIELDSQGHTDEINSHVEISLEVESVDDSTQEVEN
ncbi:sorting nexin-11 isoform X2 [Oncorhynchus nerka]